MLNERLYIFSRTEHYGNHQTINLLIKLIVFKRKPALKKFPKRLTANFDFKPILGPLEKIYC